MTGNRSIGKLVVCVLALCLLAAGAWAQPAINSGGVQNVFGNQYSAPEIARGSWFAVKGSGLGPASIVIAPGAPYPTELSGTKVTFTPASGGAAIESRMYYTLASQVAGLLPSTAVAGDYDVRVIYNSATSAPRRVKVVERNFGFATASSSGTGQAQATNASLNGGVSLVRLMGGSVQFNGLNWQYRPAYPGETLIAWGTGLGADTASDVDGGTSGDMKDAAQVKVLVGGVEITPAYAGRSSGSPGLDQINFALPPNVPQGCAVTLQVRAGGKSSNLGTLAIAASGASVCASPNLTAQQVQSLASGGTVALGSFSLTKGVTSISAAGMSFDSTNESVGGSFSKFTADDLANTSVVAPSQAGSCYFMRQQGGLSDIQQGPTVRAADAGTPLTFNGPNASNKSVPRSADNSYTLSLYSSGFGGFGGSGTETLKNGGTYTLTGPGGSEIAAFSASTPFPASFNWTNKAATTSITRGQPLNVTWTGGGSEAGALVRIVGLSGSQVGGTQENPLYDVGMFVCTAPASAGNFTVPGEATNALSANNGDIASGNIGMMIVAATNGPEGGRFTANVVGGGAAPSQFDYTWALTSTVEVK